jgi:hypothetical protein
MNGWAKPKLISYLVGIFLAGGISGAFLVYATRRPVFHGPPSSEEMIRYVRGKLEKEVGLTEQQWVEVGPIVSNATTEIGQLDHANRERIRELINQSDAAILEKLTAEQKPRMQKWIEERRKHRLGPAKQ